MEFNQLRNKIIHRLIIYSFQRHKRNKVTKTEVIKEFEKGKKNSSVAEGKNE